MHPKEALGLVDGVSNGIIATLKQTAIALTSGAINIVLGDLKVDTQRGDKGLTLVVRDSDPTIGDEGGEGVDGPGLPEDGVSYLTFTTYSPPTNLSR